MHCRPLKTGVSITDVSLFYLVDVPLTSLYLILKSLICDVDVIKTLLLEESEYEIPVSITKLSSSVSHGIELSNVLTSNNHD